MIQLEELISYRYNELLPTIFITNMNESEFKSFVGDRVASRLRENKVIRVMMDGEDLRGSLK
jgi:DNA replication protein DnaC